MAERTATATWKGSLTEGKGTFVGETETIRGDVTFASRFEEGTGTNPEELVGAALSTCFSMALSGELGEAGYEPRQIDTRARVHLAKTESGFRLDRIVLDVTGDVGGVDEDGFREHARSASENCPIARALAAVDIQLGEVQLR
jgi:osmotically inducible protein OsmC